MLHWINTHGIESLIGYYAFAALVGSMPPLPDNAGYYQRWGAGLLQGLAANMKAVAQSYNIVPKEETKLVKP